jgi:Ca-activated chloride channel family protein
MRTGPSRRTLLTLGATGCSVLLAGCSAVPRGDRDGPGAEDDEEPDPSDTADGRKVDDWQYTRPTATETALASSGASASGGGGGGGGGGDGGAVGIAAGGAKDVAQFRRNVEEGYLPLPTDLSYEGLFYEYFFDTGDPGPCTGTFCPAYSPAVTADPLGETLERYFTVGLNSGIDVADFERKTLNLVVVLDISGSMDGSFDRYYYDRTGRKREVEGYTGRPKLDVATETVASLTTQLTDADRFGMVVFNDGSQVAKPLRAVGETDMEAIRGHITDLAANGGTDLSAGIRDATGLLSAHADADPTVYETRMIVVTDAMPNLGETDDDGLRNTLAENARAGLYTTFIGVGLDTNTRLTDAVTAIEGANAYTVRSAPQFERRLTEEFEYIVTPLAFDLTVQLEGTNATVEAVYGSSAAEEATRKLVEVNTLFPAPRRDERTRGGVVLVRTDAAGGSELALRADWRTRAGEHRQTATTVQFPDGDPDVYASTGVRKAVLLTRYADLLRRWMVAERTDEVGPASDGIEPLEESYLGRWERQSTPLTVSPAYRERIARFADHFEREMRAIGDESLQQELDVLRTVTAHGG